MKTWIYLFFTKSDYQ